MFFKCILNNHFQDSREEQKSKDCKFVNFLRVFFKSFQVFRVLLVSLIVFSISFAICYQITENQAIIFSVVSKFPNPDEKLKYFMKYFHIFCKPFGKFWGCFKHCCSEKFKAIKTQCSSILTAIKSCCYSTKKACWECCGVYGNFFAQFWRKIRGCQTVRFVSPTIK